MRDCSAAESQEHNPSPQSKSEPVFSVRNRFLIRNRMTQRQRQDAAINSLRLIPTKWAILIVAILIAYVVAQPRLNNWFGINLPSLTSLLGDDSATKKPAAKNSAKPSDSKTKTRDSQSSAQDSESDDAAERVPAKQVNSERINPKNDERKNNSAKQDVVKPDKQTSIKPESAKKNTKTHGILIPIGNERFESPNGLVYGPGSEQGHRIKHIERHLKDDPKRPGSHGVFDGSLEEFLVAIDDAYLRAKRGEKGTSQKEEDNTIVYEAPFAKPIGYQGGVEGGKRKNPKLKKLRVVVRGNSLITAFPF